MSQSTASPSSCPASKVQARRGSRRRLLSDVPSHRRGAVAAVKPLTSYLDANGRPRELLALPGHGGSVLVLDRDATTLGDRRLLAHLAPDEAPENAVLVCRLYLEDIAGRWCRRVEPSDLERVPFAPSEHPTQSDPATLEVRVQARGFVYRLGPVRGERTTAQLRWSRGSSNSDGCEWEQVKLRDVVGAFENYEPVRTLTEQALERHREDPTVLSTRLRDEFERLCTSPIVLNRGLREAVLDAIERRGMTMSEIALRCGIVKHDRHGNPSGETSWLARRAGLMPEGGARTTTPWIHSDVLGAIARLGLGISPREVELQ
ncbi:MAG: hypothetical protein WBV85_05460 [Solirubrobacteraceae bacterium]